MTNDEWIDMLRVIPLDQQNQIVLVLKNQSEVAVDTLFRFEPNFLVLRGRVGGTTDESRAFFVPYDQMVYFRIERIINLNELQAIFDEQPNRPKAAYPETAATPVNPEPQPEATDSEPPITDATATRNALLDRIRAARATQANNNRVRDPSQ